NLVPFFRCCEMKHSQSDYVAHLRAQHNITNQCEIQKRLNENFLYKLKVPPPKAPLVLLKQYSGHLLNSASSSSEWSKDDHLLDVSEVDKSTSDDYNEFTNNKYFIEKRMRPSTSGLADGGECSTSDGQSSVKRQHELLPTWDNKRNKPS